MFKHILVPTDGSEISAKVIRKTMELAKLHGASVTGVHVVPDFRVFAYQAEMVADTSEQFQRDGEARAKRCLDQVEAIAREVGVPCNVVSVMAEHPYEAIIKAAVDGSCDLITMASHGRKGIKGLLLGSETQKVLTHSQIPVLVFR